MSGPFFFLSSRILSECETNFLSYLEATSVVNQAQLDEQAKQYSIVEEVAVAVSASKEVVTASQATTLGSKRPETYSCASLG